MRYLAKIYVWLNRKPSTIGPSPFQEDLLAIPQVASGGGWEDKFKTDRDPYEDLEAWMDIDKAIHDMLDAVPDIRLDFLDYLFENKDKHFNEWDIPTFDLYRALVDWL